MSPRKKKVPDENNAVVKTDVQTEQVVPPAASTSGQDPPPSADPALKVQPRVKRKVEDVPQTEASAPQQRKRILLPSEEMEVLTIDNERTLKTESEKTQDEVLDLIESLRTRRYLTDRIQGVEMGTGNLEPRAILYHGGYKVVIMASMLVKLPKNLNGYTPNEAYFHLLNKRLGAEIDYVIKGIDPNTGIAVGDRVAAMETKKRHFFLTPDRDGLYRTYEGQIVEARVINVSSGGIHVEVFGVDVWVPVSELSYAHIEDVTALYKPGDRVLAKITKLTRDHPEFGLWINISIKRVNPDPKAEAIEKVQENNSYSGTVAMFDETGIFVRLDIGANCRCKYPPRGRPILGSRVAVKITGIDYEKLVCWGLITYVAIPR